VSSDVEGTARMKVSRSGGGTLISDEALDQNRRSQVLHQ
jgi:hypothetical protein